MYYKHPMIESIKNILDQDFIQLWIQRTFKYLRNNPHLDQKYNQIDYSIESM